MTPYDPKVPVGMFGYHMEAPLGLRQATLFLWNLELPADFEPVNNDGEAQSFDLWSLERVAETIRDEDVFKFNIGPVNVDFLVRHGWLGPEEGQSRAHRLRVATVGSAHAPEYDNEHQESGDGRTIAHVLMVKVSHLE